MIIYIAIAETLPAGHVQVSTDWQILNALYILKIAQPRLDLSPACYFTSHAPWPASHFPKCPCKSCAHAFTTLIADISGTGLISLKI